MAKKRVMISIDPDIDRRWAEVAKKVKRSKSSMVEEILIEIIPILEHEKPKDIFAHALEVVGQGLMDAGSLFYENGKNGKDRESIKK